MLLMGRALGLSALLALCACAPPPALRPASATLLEAKTLEPISYVESPMFSAHYYVFRDLEGPAWGAGKVLAAYWRKELGFESRLNGLGAGGGAVLAVESPKERGANRVIGLDAHGAVISSAVFSGAFDQFRVLRAKTSGLFAVRDFWTVTVADPARGALWSPPGEYDGIAAADLDGDGQDELLARDRKGVLSAYDAGGKRLWSRKGFPELHGLVSGRLAGRGPSLVARSGRFVDGRLSVLNGRGRVELSTPVAWSEASLLAVASGRLAAVGHAYPEERDFLSLSEAGGAPVWRFDLGWTEASALAAVDLDGDGRDEIALGTASGWVLVFSDEGKLLAEKDFQEEVSHLLPGDGGRQLLVALKGIPPRIFAVGVIPAPGAWKPAAAAEPVRMAAKPVLGVTAAIESPAERLRAHDGRLMPSMVDHILGNPSYVEAKRIANDPAFRALPPHERKPLQARWKKIQAEGAAFLREARKLDREGQALFRRGLKLDKAAASLSRKRDALNRSIERCRSKCASLERKARRLERRIVRHNAGVAKWREEVAGLEARVGR